jgi:hypothetical protein
MVAAGIAAWSVIMIVEVEFEGFRGHVVSFLQNGKSYAVRKIGVVAKKKLNNSTPLIARCEPLLDGAPTFNVRTVEITVALCHVAEAVASLGRLEFKCPVPSIGIDVQRVGKRDDDLL